jgi:hypothetical protein
VKGESVLGEREPNWTPTAHFNHPRIISGSTEFFEKTNISRFLFLFTSNQFAAESTIKIMAMDVPQLHALQDLMSLGAPDDYSDLQQTGAAAYQSTKLTPGSFGPSISGSLVAGKQQVFYLTLKSMSSHAQIKHLLGFITQTNQGGVDPNHKTEVRVKRVDPKAIWNDEEIEESEASKFEADPVDSRIEPEYVLFAHFCFCGRNLIGANISIFLRRFQILYKQKVTSEDMFLGMNPDQGPSTLRSLAYVLIESMCFYSHSIVMYLLL